MDTRRIWRRSATTRRPLARLAIATLVAAVAIPVTLLAGAASASASVGGCSTNPLPGNSSVTVYTCAYISGSGTEVSYMRMDACVYGTAGAWVRFAIYAPGNSVPQDVSQPWYRSHGNCTPEFYGPSGTVTPGPWTFTSFDYSTGIVIANVVLTVRR
jgi:hypothetical protein